MFLAVIFILQLANFVFGGYSYSDNLALDQELVIDGNPVIYKDVNQPEKTPNSIVSFDDHIFGIAYFRDLQPYASFIKNGVDINGEVQIASNLAEQHGIQSCKVNEHDMLVIYSGTGQISHAQMVTKEGNNIQLKGNSFQIDSSISINGKCIQLSSNLVGIAYMAEDMNIVDPSNFGIYFNTYNLQSQTMGTRFLVNDIELGYQNDIKLGKTSSGKIIIVFQQTINLESFQMDIFYQELTQQGTKAVGKSNVRVSTQQYSATPALFCDENDNTYISWWDQGGFVLFKRFDENLVEQCTFIQSGEHPNLVAYDNIVYMRYFDSESRVIEIYGNNCTEKSASRQEISDYYNFQQDMAVSIEPQGGIFAYITSQVLGQNSKLKYTEYLLFGATACDNPICSGCYGTNTQFCRSCNGTTQGQIPLRRTDTGDCRCIDKYYDDPSENLCKDCPYGCQTCSNLNTCHTCIDSTRNQTNNCACNDGTYDDAFICTPCNYKCGTCSNSTDCDSCAVNRLRDQSGNCVCIQRYFNNPQAQECTSCSSNCLQCLNLNQCDTCEDGYYRTLENQKNICKQCSFKCATCSGTATNCTLSCQPQCSSCDITGKCTGCQINQYLDSNQNCNNCHPKCYNCQQQQDTCGKCSKGKFRLDIIHNCACQIGYYEIGEKDCARCKTLNCKICDQNGDCLECTNSKLDTKDCQSLKITEKPVAFTLQLDEKQMLDLGICSPKCLKCETKTDKCLICNLGKNRNNELPCNCLQGYHDDNGKKQNCEKCFHTCKSCNSFYQCSQCDDNKNRVFNEFQQTCDCKEGFKENKKTQSCEQCFQYSGKCLQDCPSHTIKDPINLMCKDLQYDQETLKFIYWVCGSSLCIIVVMLFILIQLMSGNLSQKLKGKFVRNFSKLQNQETRSLSSD